MRFSKISLYMICAALFLVLASGCAKPPTEEMNAARDAVTRAENNANAAAYAGDGVRRARSALERMDEEANAKRYDAARIAAAEAVAAAEKAISDGQTASARTADNASNLIVAAKTEIQAAEQSLDAAWKSGVRNINFAELNSAAAAAWQSVEQAEMSLAGGRAQDAVNSAEEARGSAARISLALSEGARAGSRKQ
ncbi:MAG: hypothetical protein LBI85_05675 [Spirochaetaceae bacterium]|jgi:hypothetical protein|nr:hypothetical protein [Spirochaetaceae bacterium]